MKGYELYKTNVNYYPIVFSMNYQIDGKIYAFISYGNFSKDSKGVINSAHITKQVVLVSSLFVNGADQ